MPTEVSEQLVKDLANKGRASLFFFARAILGFDKLTKEIHRPLCKQLEDYTKHTRTLTILPRDWFKSTICSVAYPIWRAINDPDVRILVVQNSFSNACKKLYNIKQIFENNDLFKACYPELLPRTNSVWKNECLTVARKGNFPEGTFEAAGVGTAVTSRHYDLVIEDDTVSPKKDDLTGVTMMPTKADIEKAIGWHRLSHPLLLHPKESQIMVVGTRWAERDLLGYILESSPEYKVLTRACREKDGKPATKAEGGKAVWERFDEETLDQIERDLGPYMFSALYMNLPLGAVNQVFQRDWILYYSDTPRGLVCCTSVDPASADKEESSDPDYNVILTTGTNPYNGHIYILKYDRIRADPGDIINRILYHCRTFKPQIVKIESISYQRTLCYWLKQKMKKLNDFYAIEEIRGAGASKVDRIRAIQPYFANNRIFLRSNMPELENELIAFPKGQHDDIIDALSMQINFWNEVHDVSKDFRERISKHDPHSGYSILRDLDSMIEEVNQFPNDMGIIGDKFLDAPKYRKFVNSQCEIIRRAAV